MLRMACKGGFVHTYFRRDFRVLFARWLALEVSCQLFIAQTMLGITKRSKPDCSLSRQDIHDGFVVVFFCPTAHSPPAQQK